MIRKIRDGEKKNKIINAYKCKKLCGLEFRIKYVCKYEKFKKARF